MKREVWMAAQSVSSSIMVLNALFCEYCDHDKPTLTEADKNALAKEISSHVTLMALEDLKEILDRVYVVKNSEKSS